MASVKSFSVRDFTGNKNQGRQSEQVTFSIILDEAVVAQNGTINGQTVTPTIKVGSTVLSLDFLDYNAAAKSLNYSAIIPAGLLDTRITLSAISISNITLTGAKGPLRSNPTMSLTGQYLVDSINPVFGNFSTATSINENTPVAKNVLFSVNTTEAASNISYRLSGADAKSFNIDRLGNVRLKANPDFESKSVYSLNVIATDKVGNSSSKALTLNVNNVDEAVTLRKGLSGQGAITVAKGNLTSQAKSIVGDFVNDMAGNVLTFSPTGLPTGVSLVNGTLVGSLSSKATYKFNVLSSDGVNNGKDASRQYQLVVLDRPEPTSLLVTDSDANNNGKEGMLVNIKVLLSEPIKGLPPSSGIQASFSAGKNMLSDVKFLGVTQQANQAELNFSAVLPVGDSNVISLRGLNLGGNTLVGAISGGNLFGNINKSSAQGSYLIDNSAPKITSANALVVSENISLDSIIYTATATDSTAVRYSLRSNYASLFNIDANSGVLKVVGNLNYEAMRGSLYRYQVNIIATDHNGNSSSKLVTIRLGDVNEPTVMLAGKAELSNFTLYKDVNASYYISNLSNDFVDPEGKAITYRISDGWLVPGLSLNSKTGVISGKPSSLTPSTYQFTVTASDGVNNGRDASRRYQGTITSNNLLIADDTLLGAADTAMALTLYGKFAQGGKVQLFKTDGTTAVGAVHTLTSVADSYTFNYVKTAIGLNDQSNADYVMRYISPSNTTLDSIALNITRDDIAPSLVSVGLSASGAMNRFVNAGDVVTANVSFSEVIKVSGNPTISLLIGTQTVQASYATSVGSVAAFVYTIQAGDVDNNGVSVLANGLSLNSSGRISDLADNIAPISHAKVTFDATLRVDTSACAPVMTIVDTGDSSLDYITENPSITVSALEYGASWQYRINGTGEWLNGTGNSFNALDGENRYQVRQIDLAGNTSEASASLYLDFRTRAKGMALNGNPSPQLVRVDSQNTNIPGVTWTEYFNDQTGASVSTTGDINGDGIADLIVSATGANLDRGGFASTGEVYVVFGKNNAKSINTSDIVAGSGGFVIAPQSVNLSTSVSYAGDINGDGLADLLIGSQPSDLQTSQAQTSYVIFGKTSTTPIQLSSLADANNTLGFVINGQGNFNNWGGKNYLAGVGDINGDGLADIVISAKNQIATYVVFGKTSGSAVDLTNVVTNSAGFVINAHSSGIEKNGHVSIAGDVNGDGLSDLIVGATGSNSIGDNIAGRAYVVWGKTSNTAIDLTAVTNGSGGFVLNGQGFREKTGVSVATAGDLNSDGLADLLIGAENSNTASGSSSGRVYVVWGKTSNTAIDLSAVINGTGGFVINGQAGLDRAGCSVSVAGDVNGDGLPDLVIGAYLADANGRADAGRSYVVFGKTDNNPVNLSDISQGIGTSIRFANYPSANTDTFNGNQANEIILGGAGNDTLSGGGGADVLLGASGDDRLIINASNINALQSGISSSFDAAGFNFSQLARLDGVTGIDTLQVTGGANLDLTRISQIAAGNPKVFSRISSIEKIDLAIDTSANTLKLNLSDVLNMTSMNLFNTTAGSGWTGTGLGTTVAKHQLVITGNATDIIDIEGYSTAAGANNVWAKQLVGAAGSAASTVVNSGITFEIWNHTSAVAQLLIQQGLIVN